MASTLTAHDLDIIAATKDSADHDAAHELQLYAENTAELYPQYQSIERNLLRKMERNQYEPMKARKLWRYWTDEAARRYCHEFGGSVRTMFPKATRQYAADMIASEWEQEYTDEYNAMHDRMNDDE